MNWKNIYQAGNDTDNLQKTLLQEVKRLAEISYSLENIGLYNGKTGILLALHSFKNRVQKENDLIFVNEAINQIQNDLSEKASSANDSFSDGIFGIGWAISTLYEKGYIRENETEVMNSFDDELYKLIMYQKAVNPTLEIGTIGRINYYLKRINDQLKISNKYRYVCNYESLMLLVDDFTNENEKIISQLEANCPNYCFFKDKRLYFVNIFNLLSILVSREIYPEITERQQLQFLRILIKYFDFLNNNHDVIDLNEGAWEVISLLNCLLKFLKKSPRIESYSSRLQPLISNIVPRLNLTLMNMSELITLISFLDVASYTLSQRQIENLGLGCRLMFVSTNYGLNGRSGLFCLDAGLEDKRNSLLNEVFLI